MAWTGFRGQINDRVAKSAEQDQTARMCMLILLYMIREQVHGP